MEPGEETPLGLLLCTEGSEEQIELLQLDKSGIKVAQYMTELPPRDVLMRQIQNRWRLQKHDLKITLRRTRHERVEESEIEFYY
jgi:hypothetical protein